MMKKSKGGLIIMYGIITIASGGCSKKTNIVISERGEESRIFLFKSKIRRGDPSAYSLRMTRKGKFTRILEHPHSFGEKLVVFIEFKKEILRPYGLRMTEKVKACQQLLICHSAAGEESPAFIELLNRRIYVV
jgi:hypothetical protein